MSFSFIPRRGLSVELAANALASCNIISLPVSLRQITKQFGIKCITYQTLSFVNNCTVQDVCRVMKSNDGTALRIRGRYAIVYNAAHKMERQRFTVAHEIGHILMGHLENIQGFILSRKTTGDVVYDSYEREADDFARNLLAPPAAYAMQPNKSVIVTHVIFNISRACARVRCETSNADARALEAAHMYERQKAQFTDYISTHPMGNAKNNICFNTRGRSCGVYLDKDIKVCPYCGSHTIAWLDSAETDRRQRTPRSTTIHDHRDIENAMVIGV